MRPLYAAKLEDLGPADRILIRMTINSANGIKTGRDITMEAMSKARFQRGMWMATSLGDSRGRAGLLVRFMLEE